MMALRIRGALLAAALVAALPACASQPGAVSGTGVPVNNSQAVAGTILQVTAGRAVGELRITQMTGPDAASPPYPGCLLRHAPGERIVNFDLNWAGINFGQSTAPAVEVTIAAADGTIMVAEIPGATVNTCRAARSQFLSAEPVGSQLVYGLTVRQPAGSRLLDLLVTIDRHVLKIRLSPVCNQDNCFQDNPPVPWQPGTPYSVSITI